jgi:hypothetical protein
LLKAARAELKTAKNDLKTAKSDIDAKVLAKVNEQLKSLGHAPIALKPANDNPAAKNQTPTGLKGRARMAAAINAQASEGDLGALTGQKQK